MKYLLKNGLAVTMDPNRNVFQGDLLIENDRIAAIGTHLVDSEAETIDLTGMAVIPGLIQSHIHACQALFRGLADDLALLDWLRNRIWPFEAAHNAESLYTSGMLGYAECLLGGTTTVVDMGTVHHTDSLFQAALDIGIRAIIGKALMDMGEGVPSNLVESQEEAINDWQRLHSKFHGADGGRVLNSLAPRFALSCTRPLLERVAALAQQYGVIVQTHASENRDECAAVKSIAGLGNVEYLHQTGLTGKNVVLAHCIWLSEVEKDILAQTGTVVAHCPSSNLKLASGLAAVPEMLGRGIAVTIGADGAPCNNSMDAFLEMRLASLLQKPGQGALAMPARLVFELATVTAATALNLPEIGSLVTGKKADVVAVDLERCHQMYLPEADIYSALVYSAKSSDVRHVWVDGQMVVGDGRPLTADAANLLQKAKIQAAAIRQQVCR
ncbi:MAG TPA: N-ethylammeline chlorohydrolase [Firmicutes bacterium]|nr:N-ethylammeline chlorohydrolase [Bacillota bacterium]HAW71355.1 N-ethylammeline chlorohydrolase [Bacillota bacterium]HBE05538.1 N-ethylammeline chlorohydrolase [Bacillota bacterium]HBL50913.1 N-ethylammeline chlorohydrolase [Bacillota bacterium]HBR23747.1 N-ethylammeline chlorohydrolase [Bacillota bacterium]